MLYAGCQKVVHIICRMSENRTCCMQDVRKSYISYARCQKVAHVVCRVLESRAHCMQGVRKSYIFSHDKACMGWLVLVGSLKLLVSFAEYRLFCRALVHKRPVILRNLLVEATP